MARTRVLIAGAAGRDFHNFNLVYRGRAEFDVVAFTATQIPNIDGRVYPAELAGALYPNGIPILPESALEQLVREHEIDEVVFAYSDVTHEHVMHIGSRALAAGASYRLISPRQTMLRSTKPVVAICAVRTGSGKSQTTRRVAQLLRESRKRVAVLRHPLPYGDLAAQAVQRFERYEDLEAADATIEEREEYEPHLSEGNLVFAGIDYERILRAAEQEADVVLWDGGNNDTPFIEPDVHIVVVDPRACAVGTIAETFEQYPHVGALLPAMGYGRRQMKDLRATIRKCEPDLVLIGTPIDLRRLIDLETPALRVTYRLQEMGEPTLKDVLMENGLIEETALV